MAGEAIGMIEVFGFTTAVCVADAAAKAADVEVIALDSNKPANAETVEVPLIMCVKIQGSVAAVEAGVAAGAKRADEISGLIQTHVIARPTEDSEKMARRCSVGRDRVGHIPNNG